MSKKKKTPKRSARSYKLGAQKAAASRAKNKLKKELQVVNRLPTSVIKGKKKGSISIVINYEGVQQTLKEVQNRLINSITRINTDYISPINKKLGRYKKKTPKRLLKFQAKEGTLTVQSYRAWHKTDFSDKVFELADRINGLSVKTNADKIQDKIDKMFEDMESKDFAGYSINEDSGILYFFKNNQTDLKNSEDEETE